MSRKISGVLLHWSEVLTVESALKEIIERTPSGSIPSLAVTRLLEVRIRPRAKAIRKAIEKDEPKAKRAESREPSLSDPRCKSYGRHYGCTCDGARLTDPRCKALGHHYGCSC